MKKLFITMCVALLSMTAQAQEKGDFAIGARGGVSFAKVEFGNLKENVTRFGIGAFGQYSFSNHWRLELEGMYHPKKDHVSDFTLGLGIQYLVNVAEDFKIYPQVGYALAFVHSEGYTETLSPGSTITTHSQNSTDGGIQFGVGFQYNAGENWFLGADYKFQPGIFGNCHNISLGVGFIL